MIRHLLILSIIFLSIIDKSISQNIKFEYDSVVILIYEGGNYEKQLGYSYKKKRKNKKKNAKRNISTEKRDTSFLEVVSSEGKLNPTIINESIKDINQERINNILDIINCNTNNKNNERLYGLCYNPRHSIIFFNLGKIQVHYDICFECHHVKKNGKIEVDCIDINSLKIFFQEEQLPITNNEITVYKNSISNN